MNSEISEQLLARRESDRKFIQEMVKVVEEYKARQNLEKESSQHFARSPINAGGGVE